MNPYLKSLEELNQLPSMPTKPTELGPIRNALFASGLFDKIDPKKNIIVAGTNGKGSTAATLSCLLHQAGQRIGLYTSPHLIRYEERIRIGEQDISPDHFAQLYEQAKPWIIEYQLTQFESLTLMAAFAFFSQPAAFDWVIWEVGLGGARDATNAIPHHYCIITRLGLDHEALLGSDLIAIAKEKFGVVMPGNTVIHSPLPKPITAIKQDLASTSYWRPACPFELSGLDQISTPWGEAKIGLKGYRAAENTATALTAFEALGFPPKLYLKDLIKVRWPGRFQQITWPPLPCPIYLSGDHNPQGVTSLVEILKQLTWRRLHIVLGLCEDKPALAVYQPLAELPRTILYLTETPFKKTPLAAYPAELRQIAVQAQEDAVKILDQLSVAAEDLIVVTGSLYLVGYILSTYQARNQLT